MTLEEIARAEAANAAQREAHKQAYAAGQKRLLRETPERFFALARQLREGVERFNAAAKSAQPILHRESAAVTTRDANLNHDFSVEIRRDPHRLSVALRLMNRMGLAPDALVIEGQGSVGVPQKAERFFLRIEGVARQDQTAWRVTSDFRPVEGAIDALGDKLVAVIATGELARLFAGAAPAPAEPRPSGRKR